MSGIAGTISSTTIPRTNRARTGPAPWAWLVLVGGVAGVAALGLTLGVVFVPLDQVVTILTGGEADRITWTGIVLDFRLPRVAAGQFTVLLGPNGAGKSTLIRTMAGLQAPLAGHVRLDGEDVHAMAPRERARRLAVVLTQQVKVWGLTSRGLVALGRHPHTSLSAPRRPADDAAIDRALEACGAESLAERELAELSDGERQRVMVARALAQEPRALILDEVTAFLDLPHRVDIMLMLRRLAHTAGVAMLLSTHDLDLALRIADRIWLIAPGGAFSIGTPESLVLSGALDGVFRHDGVRFDRQTGSFSLQERRHGRATVTGAGLHAEWTRRAVERLGYQVTHDGPAEVHVAVDEGRAAPAWELSAAGRATRYATIDALADAIRDLRLTTGSRAQ